MIVITFGAIVAGFADASVGSGGFILLGSMLLMSVPPHLAIGAYKLTTFIGTTFGIFRLHQEKTFSFKDFPKKSLFIMMFFSMIGAFLITVLPGSYIQKIAPVMMTLMLIYKIYNFNHAVHSAEKPKMDLTKFYIIFPALLGFYDGFFGPGIMSLSILCLTTVAGVQLLNSAGIARSFAWMGRIGSIPIFFATGFISIPLSVFLSIGYLIGTEAGVRMAVKKGSKFINVLLVIMMCLMSLHLWHKYYF